MSVTTPNKEIGSSKKRGLLTRSIIFYYIEYSDFPRLILGENIIGYELITFETVK